MTNNNKISPRPAIDMDRFQTFLEEVLDGEGSLSWADPDTLDSFVQKALESAGPLELPEGAEAVAYFLDGDDPGFVFGLRPTRVDTDSPFRGVNVTGTFVECRDVEPRDDEGRVAVDGAQFDTAKAALDCLERIVDQLDPLVPAYLKLWEHECP